MVKRLGLWDWVALSIGLSVLALGLRASGFGLRASGSSPPDYLMSVDRPDHDFGPVDEGTALVHEFTIKNSGALPAEILKTSISCGCTDVKDLAGTLILPGQTLQLPTRIDTQGKRGKFRGVITLYYRSVGQVSNNPQDVEMHLIADVKPEITLVPDSINFGTIPAGRTETIKFTLRAKTDEECRRFQPTTRDELLTLAELPCPVAATRTFRLTLKSGSAHPGGRFDSHLAVLKDGVERFDRRLPYCVAINPLIRAEPPSIIVASDVLGIVSRTLVVSSARLLTVKSAVCSDDRVHLTEPGRSASTHHTWKITIDPPTQWGTISAKLLLNLEVANDTGAIEAVAVSIPINRLTPSKE